MDFVKKQGDIMNNLDKNNFQDMQKSGNHNQNFAKETNLNVFLL